MSGTVGTVTRKDGRILDLPERVQKIFKWLIGLALSVPLILTLTLADKAVLGPVAGPIIALLPLGLVCCGLVAVLREGKWGNAAFGASIVLLHFMAWTLSPATSLWHEALLSRLLLVVGTLVILWMLKLDLHYNLRPLWYSLDAMRQFQEMASMAKAAKDAKKAGKPFDKNQVMNAEAIVRTVQAQTGREIPKHMAGGFTTKPGFRQPAKSKGSGGSSGSSSSSGSGAKKRK